MQRKITSLIISLMLIIAAIGFTAPTIANADAPIALTPSSASGTGYTISTVSEGTNLTISNGGSYTISGTWHDI